jgi:hypothetical protein
MNKNVGKINAVNKIAMTSCYLILFFRRTLKILIGTDSSLLRIRWTALAKPCSLLGRDSGFIGSRVEETEARINRKHQISLRSL